MAAEFYGAVSCFFLHFFCALAASYVLHNGTEHSQSFSIFLNQSAVLFLRKLQRLEWFGLVITSFCEPQFDGISLTILLSDPVLRLKKTASKSMEFDPTNYFSS